MKDGYGKKYYLLMKNDTCKLVSSPNGANFIMKKGCFKDKNYWFGYFLKYKVRWVAHRYKQKEKLAYVKMFAAVIKLISYKCLFAVEV